MSALETEPASVSSRQINAVGVAAAGAAIKIVRNQTPAPMSAPNPGHSLVTLTLRFAVLLIIAIVLMALAWSR